MSSEGNPERIKRWRAANREKMKATSRAYYLKNREKCKRLAIEWQMRNKKRHRELTAKSQRQNRRQLGDSYIKGYIYGQTGLRFHEIPKPLVAAVRALIQLKRNKWKKGIYGNRSLKYKFKRSSKVEPADQPAADQQPQRSSTCVV